MEEFSWSANYTYVHTCTQTTLNTTQHVDPLILLLLFCLAHTIPMALCWSAGLFSTVFQILLYSDFCSLCSAYRLHFPSLSRASGGKLAIPHASVLTPVLRGGIRVTAPAEASGRRGKPNPEVTVLLSLYFCSWGQSFDPNFILIIIYWMSSSVAGDSRDCGDPSAFELRWCLSLCAAALNEALCSSPNTV